MVMMSPAVMMTATPSVMMAVPAVMAPAMTMTVG